MGNRSSILLVSHRNEPFCTERVASALRARGFAALRLDTDEFPSTLSLSGELGLGTRPTVFLGDEVMEVAAVWLWRIWPPRFDAGLDATHRDAAMRESMTTLRGLLDLLAGVPWIDAI